VTPLKTTHERNKVNIQNVIITIIFLVNFFAKTILIASSGDIYMLVVLSESSPNFRLLIEVVATKDNITSND
jgi:hypothetical protein